MNDCCILSKDARPQYGLCHLLSSAAQLDSVGSVTVRKLATANIRSLIGSAAVEAYKVTEAGRGLTWQRSLEKKIQRI